MKATLILCGTALFITGCGTTEKTAFVPDTRVDRTWAREAGLQEQEWYVAHKEEWLADEESAVQPAMEAAQGGASTVGQTVTISTFTGGLEILDQAEIELRKEEMVVGKREVSNGGVLVRTVVETEEVSQPIELRREGYIIERIPAGSTREQQARGENAFLGREIYIPLMREQAISGKRVLVTEAIKIGKRIETDHQTVSMPVRTEDIQIVKNPDLADPKFATVPRRTGVTSFTETGAALETTPGVLKLTKEELVVGKQEVDAGGVYLQKIIKTETASQPVELRREEYVVERTPLSGQVVGAGFAPRQIMLGLTREEAVAGTRNYVAETVRVRKQMEADQQLVAGTVRKEGVEIVKLAGQEILGQGGTSASGQSAVTLLSESGNIGKSRDQILKEHVEKTLACEAEAINVSTHDGIVTLKGTVSSEKEKKSIGKQVEKMSGVRSVDNQLEIEMP